MHRDRYCPGKCQIAGPYRQLRWQGPRAAHAFGTRISTATPLDEGSVVGMRMLPGNPQDGHAPAGESGVCAPLIFRLHIAAVRFGLGT